MGSYYSFETRFQSLAKELSCCLNEMMIGYERSKCFNGYRFEILATPMQFGKINEWLDVNSIRSAFKVKKENQMSFDEMKEYLLNELKEERNKMLMNQENKYSYLFMLCNDMGIVEK